MIKPILHSTLNEVDGNKETVHLLKKTEVFCAV